MTARLLAAAVALACFAAPALAQEAAEDEQDQEILDPYGDGEEDAEPVEEREEDIEESVEEAAEDEAVEEEAEEQAEEEEPEEGDEEAGAEAEELAGGTRIWLGPEPEPDEHPEDSELIIPPLYLASSGQVTTRAVFPLFFQRESPDDYQLLAGIYYHRRGLELNADVIFPFFWSFRTVDSTTVAIPPVFYNTDADGFDWAVAPFIFDGRSDDAVYTVIPPLLTVSWADEDSAHTFAGPFWRIRDREEVDWGIFPLLWVSAGGAEESTIAAPLFFRFVDNIDRTALTIVPPVYHRITTEETYWGLAPLFHHWHDEDGTSLTIPPLLFHYSNEEDDTRLITPLFAYLDVDDAETLITPLYQRHRGNYELDSVFPIFWSWRQPQQYASALVIPPLLYTYSSPEKATTIGFPLFGYWHERGVYSTWATPLVAHYESHEDESAGTWVFPNLQFSHTPTSNTINIHPLVYSTSADTHRHFVIAPIYWDFEDYEDDSRITIGFPLLWRFRNGSTVSQLALNTYYHHYREGGVPGWEFHFFPLFAYGEPRPGDHWWSILYGLVGYQRQGAYARMQLFYIPFQVDGPGQRAGLDRY